MLKFLNVSYEASYLDNALFCTMYWSIYRMHNAMAYVEHFKSVIFEVSLQIVGCWLVPF